MARPVIRTAALDVAERAEIRRLLVTTRNAHAALTPYLEGVGWHVFRLSLAGYPATPRDVERIRGAFARWRLATLRDLVEHREEERA